MTAAPVFKDLEGLVKSLKGDLFSKWMRRAQKQVLTEWRDRDQAPGLAARFMKAGEAFYQFSKRLARKNKPFYIKTGSLRALLLKRKPKAKKNHGDQVVTTFKYGGGALNFLRDKHGINHATVSTVRYQVDVAAHARGTVQVRAYQQAKSVHRIQATRASLSYAAEFAEFNRDQAWIEKRVPVIFSMIARKASINRKTGGIKSSVLENQDSE